MANIRQAQPDERLARAARRLARRSRGRLQQRSRSPPPSSNARARLREPRTSAVPKRVLAPLASQPGAGATLRRLYAEVLQYRHEFAAAEAAARRDPARALRTIAMRACCAPRCAWCAAISPARAPIARNSPPAVAIDAAASASPVSPKHSRAAAISTRGLALLDNSAGGRRGPPRRAPICWPRAPSCANAASDPDGAIADYRAALELAPRDDSIRAALADALAARGDARRSARRCWRSTSPASRCWCAARRCPRARARREPARARHRLARARSRSRRCHSLPRSGNAGAGRRRIPPGARGGATEFRSCRGSLPDVRVLARAAWPRAMRARCRRCGSGCASTGYRDSVTENILGDARAQLEWQREKLTRRICCWSARHLRCLAARALAHAASTSFLIVDAAAEATQPVAVRWDLSLHDIVWIGVHRRRLRRQRHLAGSAGRAGPRSTSAVLAQIAVQRGGAPCALRVQGFRARRRARTEFPFGRAAGRLSAAPGLLAVRRRAVHERRCLAARAAERTSRQRDSSPAC